MRLGDQPWEQIWMVFVVGMYCGVGLISFVLGCVAFADEWRHRYAYLKWRRPLTQVDCNTVDFAKPSTVEVLRFPTPRRGTSGQRD